MIFSGLQKTSLSDFPGVVSAVVFTQGCNFRCPYCHNPELVMGSRKASIEEKQVLHFLEKRCGRLGGLVVTGGEPTLHDGLPRFLAKVKSLDYSVKLDTNGSRPLMVSQLLEEGLVDYVAMDVKAPLSKYSTVARSSVDADQVARSIEVLLSNGIPHEFRTTAVRSCLSEDDIVAIGKLLLGAQQYVLQPCVSEQTLDRSLAEYDNDFTTHELALLSQQIRKSDLNCWVR